MDMKDVFDQLDRAGRLERLDDLLDARQRMRNVYSALGDAYNVTRNRAFLMYMRMLAVAGKELNDDITAVLSEMNATQGDFDDLQGYSDPAEEG